MNVIAADAIRLSSTISLLHADSNSWPCYLEFAKAHRNRYPSSVISDSDLNNRMAEHLGVMVTMRLYRKRPGQRHTKNLRLAMGVTEVNPTSFGLWLFKRSKRTRFNALWVLVCSMWIRAYIKRQKWIITTGAFSMAAVNAAKFYSLAFQQISYLAATVLVGIVIILFVFIARKLSDLFE